MCGIAAMVTREPRELTGAVQRMVAALRHRGPDGQGVHHFGRCTLGSARLSVVDIDGGRQPILSTDERLGVTFNGAIYGFRELRTELTAYPFRTSTDTELILALYAKHGDGFLTHLPGMFAFALWDDRRQLLTCARDRFGEKPLYYAHAADGSLLVASEIKALLASNLLEPVLDHHALSHFLQRLAVHPSQTIYANIHVLPPAHSLRFRDGLVTTERYWEPPEIDHSIRMEDAVERFRELFDAAVQKQLVADVPVGVLLSGGVDSSTVAAVASQRQPGLTSFSFGFAEGVESELPYARGVAQKYATRHIELRDDHADIADLLVRMQSVYDEPFADSSALPTFLICELARRHVTVVLGGDGADELLGGYVCWARHFLTPTNGGGPHASRLKAAAKWMMRGFVDTPPTSGDLVQRYARGYRSCFSAQEQRRLGVAHDADHLVDYSRYTQGTLGDMLRFDTDLYLPGDILVKTDRASMANGLEMRSPFLDVDVASFCLSLRDDLKVDDDREKLLLRKSYEHLWTPEVRVRSKQGFGAPIGAWLKQPGLSCLKRDILGDRNQPIFDVLDFDAVQAFVERDTQQTWSLLVLALWMADHAMAVA